MCFGTIVLFGTYMQHWLRDESPRESLEFVILLLAMTSSWAEDTERNDKQLGFLSLAKVQTMTDNITKCDCVMTHEVSLGDSTVFLGGIPSYLADYVLEAYLQEHHGPVTHFRKIIDRKSGHSKGYGFVTFESPDIAKKIILQGSICVPITLKCELQTLLMYKTIDTGYPRRKNQ